MKYVILKTYDENYDAEIENNLEDTLNSMEITDPDDNEEIEWTVREPRRGEAEGTYYRRDDGSLQILGYSIPLDEKISDAVNTAWEIACG